MLRCSCWSAGAMVGDAVVETFLPRMAGVGPPFCCSNLVHLFPVLLSRRHPLCYAHQTALWTVDVALTDEGPRLTRQAVTCQAPRCADVTSNASGIFASANEAASQTRAVISSTTGPATLSPARP